MIIPTPESSSARRPSKRGRITAPSYGGVRCEGPIRFRSALARDMGCLLDLDPDLRSWRCMPLTLSERSKEHVPDFAIDRGTHHVLVDVVPRKGKKPPDWVEQAAEQQGYAYEAVPEEQIRSIRLENARDLLPYANARVTLGDRLRVLAALDERGSMTIAECMSAFREADPIGSLAALVLHRFVEFDLDETRIGPETQVRRRRD